MRMDNQSLHQEYLSKVREVVDQSIEEVKDRWDKIFEEYLRLMFEESAESANLYLAKHLGEVDLDFQLYFVSLHGVLEKHGQIEAAKHLGALTKDFISSYQNYRSSRIRVLAKHTGDIADHMSAKVTAK